MIDKIDRRTLQPNLNLETLPLDLNIPDWIMLLLFAGIGIYHPFNTKLDYRYTEKILNLAAEGKLAFVISDDNICYGANYPFSHVIIDECLADKHSIGTIFQLAGRAGRVGESWVAYAHIGDNTSQRIMNYIKGVESLGTMEEAKNLNDAFKLILEEQKTTKPLEFVIQTENNSNDATKKNRTVTIEINGIRKEIPIIEIGEVPREPDRTTREKEEISYLPPHKRLTSEKSCLSKDKSKK